MRSISATRAGVALGVFALLGAACGGQEGAAPAAPEDEQALCAEAAAHVQTCFPDVEIGTPEACDPAQAADLLSRPCEELQAVDANKADGLCAPWLWWTWQRCLPSSGGGAGATGQPLYVSLSTCDDDFCLGTLGGGSCALVTLEDASGVEVARDYTNTNSSARFEGLAPGVYTVKVWTREGALAEQMISEGLSLSGRAPATQEVAVVTDEVPSYQRRPNPDYQDLAERYATGVEVEFATQTFTLEDALTEVAHDVEVTPSRYE